MLARLIVIIISIYIKSVCCTSKTNITCQLKKEYFIYTMYVTMCAHTNDIDYKVVKLIPPAISEDSSLYYSHVLNMV